VTADPNALSRRGLAGLAAALAAAAPAAAQPVQTRGGYQEANGLRHYFERAGSGPPLVLLHGGAMVAETWRPLLPSLARRYAVYVPERRGVGRTPDRPGPWTYQGMADDMAAFMDAQGVKNAVLVGHSDGGIIGLLLAAKRPDLVRRLVASGANINPQGLGPMLPAMTAMSLREFLDEAPPQVAPSFAIHRRVSPDRGASLEASLAKMKAMWLDFDVPKATLAAIRAPTLIAAGDQDLITVAHTVEMWSAIPKAELLIVPGSNHFWMTDHPALFEATVGPFLTRA
jgi:pimeloyl-ACP methyl ester carboxylesterase